MLSLQVPRYGVDDHANVFKGHDAKNRFRVGRTENYLCHGFGAKKCDAREPIFILDGCPFAGS